MYISCHFVPSFKHTHTDLIYSLRFLHVLEKPHLADTPQTDFYIMYGNIVGEISKFELQAILSHDSPSQAQTTTKAKSDTVAQCETTSGTTIGVLQAEISTTFQAYTYAAVLPLMAVVKRSQRTTGTFKAEMMTPIDTR
jgi:hypothetical protein